MTDDPGDMVAIGTAGDPMEGAMIRELLTSEREPAEGEDREEKADDDEGEEDGSDVMWREDAELVRKARSARLVAFALPGFGLGHFAVGARVRGLILFLPAWPVAIWLANRTPAAFALVPISAFIDFLGAHPAPRGSRASAASDLTIGAG